MFYDRISLREMLGFEKFKEPAKYEDNMRKSYFTGASSRNMMFDDEDTQTGINAGADIVFGKKRRGSIFGQDLGNMFGN